MTAAQFKICMFTYFIQYLLHFTILRSYRNLQNKISKVGLNGCAYWSITRPNTVLYITAPDAKSLGLEVHRFSDKPAYEFKCRLLTFTTWSFEILHLDPIGLHFLFSRDPLAIYRFVIYVTMPVSHNRIARPAMLIYSWMTWENECYYLTLWISMNYINGGGTIVSS